MTPKNLILCFDGTNNQFGVHNTNVIRLVQAVDRDRQLVYYDPGVGTLPEPRMMTRIGKKVSEWLDLAFGGGLAAKVEAAYRYLMDFWEPESQVFIFGFSRGAYTARVLAGMLHSLGLLSPGNDGLVRYAMNLFQSIRGSTDEPVEKTYWPLSNGFRKTFARQTADAQRHFPVHFLGLWDTVSSVGWVWEPKSFPFSAKNPSVHICRHAISIDEKRAFFRSNRLSPQPGQEWLEMWFPGVHADVGGGYPEEDGGLWLPAFDWMVNEAARFGLIIDDDRLSAVRDHGRVAPLRAFAEPAHESLAGAWKLAEYFPKRRWAPKKGYHYRANRYRPRTIPDGAPIHESALRRIREENYRPANFSETFLEKISMLDPIPPWLPFESDSGH